MKHHADKVQSIAWHTSEVVAVDEAVQAVVGSSKLGVLIVENLCLLVFVWFKRACVCDAIESFFSA